jgi:peptidoglycan lytic transglycosylase G
VSRTPEEREAARLERERRRAARAGASPPSEPESPAPLVPDERRASGPGDPEVVDHPAERPPDSQATQMFDVTAAWAEERAAVAAPAAPAAPAPEIPLGTRRVGAHERGGGTRRRGGRPPGPRAPRSRRRWARRAGALLAIVAIALAGWMLWSIYQPGVGEGSGRVLVTVPSGATVSEIGDLLAARGVIDSPFFFKLRAKLSGAGGDLKSGTFRLRHDMSYGAALDALSQNPPPPPVIHVTIPEGKSRRETIPIARAAGVRGDYLAASRSSKLLDPRRYGAPKSATLEGFLFPATYELRRSGASARALVGEQVTAFKQNLAKVDLRYARSKNLTVFDVVTIASMVEREVMVARERPLVAAVIYNRLKQGIPLGIDATLRYELNDWTHPLKQSQLAANTPYNTRTSTGLPPGPIGNPGLASLQAAAHPAKVPYLFYVVKPGTCGEHAFSSTDAQFERDVQRYNEARDAAGGKSPTRC